MQIKAQSGGINQFCFCTQTLVYPSGCCIPIGLHHFQLVSSHSSPSSHSCESCFIVHSFSFIIIVICSLQGTCMHTITTHVKFLDVDVGKGGGGEILYRSLHLQLSNKGKLQTSA